MIMVVLAGSKFRAGAGGAIWCRKAIMPRLWGGNTRRHAEVPVVWPVCRL